MPKKVKLNYLENAYKYALGVKFDPVNSRMGGSGWHFPTLILEPRRSSKCVYYCSNWEKLVPVACAAWFANWMYLINLFFNLGPVWSRKLLHTYSSSLSILE